MAERLKEAFGYIESQQVRLLIVTSGEDASGTQRSYPTGTTGVIDRIERFDNEQGIAMTLVIGPTDGDEAIVNLFDELDGHPSEFFATLNPAGSS